MSSSFCILPLLSFIFLSSSTFLVAESHLDDSSYEAFPRCFLHSTGSTAAASDHLLYTFNSSSYFTVYLSTALNPRILTAPRTTRPIFIVTPALPSQVQAAVTCGRRHGFHVRARSGGHDYEGLSYVSEGDPFFILDLRNFRSVDANTSDGTAWIGAGATLGDVYGTIARASATYGFPAGVCPTVGAGGHISGGGFGTLLRKYGVAADRVIDAVIVDVEGRILDRESMGEDLFWAIRGGGAASFGVILAYRVRLVEVTPKVTVFRINRTLEQGAIELVDKWQYVAPNLDDDVFLLLLVGAVDSPASRGNRTVTATFECLFLGGRSDLLSILDEAFPELGAKASDMTEMSWIESTAFFAGYTTGPYKGKSDFVREPISAEGWKKIYEFLLRGRDEPLVMVINPWKGKMEEIAEDAIAFPHRSGNLYNIHYFLTWQEQEDERTEAKATQRHLRWMRELHRFMTPYVSKHPRAAYFNYKDLDLGMNREPASKTSYVESKVWGKHYFLSNFERLAKVKAQVDPTDYFWNEVSIPPYSSP